MENFDFIFESNDTRQNTNEDFDREAWAQQKQTERDGVFSMLDTSAIESVSSSDSMRQYLDLQSRFMRMSANNALLIAAQCPNATKLATFDEWKQQGISILAGEKAVSILEQGSSYTREDGTEGRYANVAKVFDISQTDSNQQFISHAYNTASLMKSLSAHAPASIEMSDSLPDGRNAYYQQKNNTIYVRRKLDADTLFSSLTNELAIAVLCKDGSAPRENSAAAYAAAYILCKKYGMDTQQFSVDKLCAALGNLDAKGIRDELSKARDAADSISYQMEKTLNPQQRTDRGSGER